MKKAFLTSTLGLAFIASAHAGIIISEAHPNGSGGTNGYGADFFELTNTGAAAVDITGWKMDDNSNSFASAVALRGVTSINPGQSVVFIEGDATGSTDSTIWANFESSWFGSNVPAGFTIGGYGGSGVGLSTGGDAVNIFDAAGNRVTGIAFGAFIPATTFDNAAGLGSTTLPLPVVSTGSAVGVNGGFSSFFTPSEVGSPGAVPEPTTVTVLGSALFAMASRRRGRT
jgi:hypothetical protein